ncbi:MAG: EamA family transporter [Hyphomicrobiaceae bacterium]
MKDTILQVASISLVASLIFGLSNHVQRIALDHMDVRTGTLINVATTAVLLWLISPFFLVPATLMTTSASWFALSGLIVPSLSMTFHTLSVRVIGPALTAGLASTSPVFAMAIAVLALGEIVSTNVLVGTVIVVVGIAIVALSSRGTTSSWPLWAVAIPLGAALARGLSHNAVKIGLEGLPSPLTAAFVATSTSLLVVLLLHIASVRTLPAWNAGYLWFGLCGVMNGLGLVGLMIALHLGDVTIVAPLISTTPIFTLVTGWLFFRRETLPFTSVAAIMLIFCGCLLVIM